MKIIIGMLERANKLPPSKEKMRLLHIASSLLEKEIHTASHELQNELKKKK